MPTIYHRSRIEMVSTLRLAHPTRLRTDLLFAQAQSQAAACRTARAWLRRASTAC